MFGGWGRSPWPRTTTRRCSAPCGRKLYVCIYIYMYRYISLSMYVYIYIYTYIEREMYLYIYIYIHTYSFLPQGAEHRLVVVRGHGDLPQPPNI